MKKIIVAHPGRQHSFKIASELKKTGMLQKYITTVYDKDASILMKTVKMLDKGDNLKRVNGRKNKDLLDSDVIQYCELGGLIEILLFRLDKSRNIYNWWQRHNADWFGKRVAKYAIKNDADAVIMYDTNALKAFSILEKKAPHIIRIMDISAANRIYMKTVYEEDFKRCPYFSKRLKDERKLLWNKKAMKRLTRELELTHYYLAPSTFVKKSLKFSGIDENRIAICPYGANFDVTNSKRTVKVTGAIEAVYVGNVTEMKGIFYLLEAAKEIDKSHVHLTVVGAFDNSDGILTSYMEHISFIGRVTHDKVLEILNKSDVFVFPSLGEGLSLSVLEALACGLPCIVTENSGANDAIENGKNGYVVDIQDKSALKEKMMWFDSHREQIPEMSENAKQTIEQFNWEKHEKKMIQALNIWIKNREDKC